MRDSFAPEHATAVATIQTFVRSVAKQQMTLDQVERKKHLSRLHHAINHPSVGLLLVFLQKSLPDGALLHEEINRAVLELKSQMLC